jgi:hypothetical protein
MGTASMTDAIKDITEAIRDNGPVWFKPLSHPTKILVIPNLLMLVWFVANFLATNRTTCCCLTDSSQYFG